MKSLLFTSICLFSIALTGQKTIFLHHSTGGGVFNGGIGLQQWFSDYNNSHQTSYEIGEFSYPNSPYPWDNYPFDYWNLWVNPGMCNNSQPGIRCLDWFTDRYDVIIFKHCFPGAGILPDTGNPQISSSRKSIENYMLQYRALRDLMDNYPDNTFIVWTLAPLHRNSTDPESAARARQFVNWVKYDWLAEDSKTHPNIHIFDFFGYAAESDPNPVNGELNCLKYTYEIDHNGSDSHPNEMANNTIMPFFGQFIMNVIENNTSSSIQIPGKNTRDLMLFPNPAREYFKLKEVESFESVEVITNNGKCLYNYKLREPEINISFLPKGNYFVIARNGELLRSGKLIIQ